MSAMAANQDDGRQPPLAFRSHLAPQTLRTVGRGAGRVLQFLARWVLRLALPLLCAAAVMQAFPYHATVQGVPFEVQGTLLHRTTLSADTTLGSWEFPDFVGLPFGVHISPEDVDVLHLAELAGGDMPGFVARLQADFTDQVPQIAGWLLGEFLVALAIGLAIAASINMSLRYLRGIPRRPRELRHRALQLGAAGLAVVAVGAYGVATYNPNWVRESRLTGTLAAAQLFPGQLSDYYSQQSKAFDVLGSVIGIQAALQAQIEDEAPETALQIMTISDMHLAANYPLVGQYAASYGVDLIVNTGDESAFGTGLELTPAYLDALRAVTATTPMLWVAGNHDSPATVDVLRGIPGVTVLGTKTAREDGYAVTAGIVQAYGLTIAGLSDPRVYGAPGAYGADATDVTDPLERAAVEAAVGRAGSDGEEGAAPAAESGPAEPSLTDPTLAEPTLPDAAVVDTTPADVPDTADGDAAVEAGPIDLFATHEPVQAEALREVLPGQIRQTVSGHVHGQNANDEVQDGAAIDLVEGSTGAGGLDNIVRGAERPPIEFSIESVGADCQFTRVIRFSIAPEETGTPVPDPATPQAYGNDVTASTVYFRPQDVADDRTCGTELGIGAERPWPR
jgi:predicted MPP superfamily phosphohydrolase